MRRLFAWFSILVLSAALAGCESDSMGTDGGGGGTDAGPGDTDAGGGGTDAGPGEADAGPGETDAGPGETDAGPGETDAGGGTDGGLPAGACTNSADDAVLSSIDVETEARMCGNRCFGGAMCVTMCMEDLGLSNGCATCFGEVAQCTARNCALQCTGGDEARCTMCRMMAGCVTSFETCSGLPGT